MHEIIEEIKSDVKEIKGDLKGMVSIMARNTASLEVHEARTTASEKRIEKMEGWFVMSVVGLICLAAKLLLHV